jgi:hypothetical protein
MLVALSGGVRFELPNDAVVDHFADNYIPSLNHYGRHVSVERGGDALRRKDWFQSD